MSFKIFYAWQSDRANAINRSFIETALQKAASAVKGDIGIEDAPEIQQDTSGVAGTPHIAATIAERIKAADLFLADVTFVGTQGQGASGKLLSNPNVLLELGLAAAILGWERVVLVMNTAFGGPEHLPFDLRHHRFPLRYEAPEAARATPELRAARVTLQRELESAIKLGVAQGRRSPAKPNVLVFCGTAVVLSREIFDRRSSVDILVFTVVNDDTRPVEIHGAGLIVSDNTFTAHPDILMQGARLLQGGQSVTYRIPLDPLKEELIRKRKSDKDLRVLAAYARDAASRNYHGDVSPELSDALTKEN